MGGSSTSSTTVPPWMERGSKSALKRGQEIGNMGYVPYYGPDVAAFTPEQQAAFRGTAQAADAFGMDHATHPGMGGMGRPTRFANGMTGFSSAPILDQSIQSLYQERPNQFGYLNSFSVDPYAGKYAPVTGHAHNGGGHKQHANNGKGGGKVRRLAGGGD